MDETPKPQPLDYRRPPAKRLAMVEDPEARAWRYRRIFFRIGLFALLSPFIFYFGPNLINFGKLTTPTQADLIPLIQQYGVPVVRAMKEYHRDTGQWPANPHDLVPKYLPDNPHGWDISTMNGEFDMVDQYYDYIIFYTTPGGDVWDARGPIIKGRIPIPQITIGPTTAPTQP